MGHTAIPGFTQAAQQAQQWVNELAGDLGWEERRAYRLLRCVLHALRDWLTPKEMSDFAAQLPVLVRGIYFEGWQPLRALARDRKKEDFVRRVDNEFTDDPLDDTDAAIAAVFGLLDRHLSQGEIAQVRHSMRKPLRQLWPVH
ncbi:MAG: DUF2267 domain-containing protein [Mesorhizobium sp.]|nr:DUF2267 domain-containing protein [Mesorhizobium sp.]MCO5160140.1 DUF2267 domain-containing protein [Mesorhizobium sp.]